MPIFPAKTKVGRVLIHQPASTLRVRVSVVSDSGKSDAIAALSCHGPAGETGAKLLPQPAHRLISSFPEETESQTPEIATAITTAFVLNRAGAAYPAADQP